LWGKEKISKWGDCVLCDRKTAIVNHQGLCVDHFVTNTYAQRKANSEDSLN